jgi:glycosyltransferase involved in cell wall biosynthesis
MTSGLQPNSHDQETTILEELLFSVIIPVRNQEKFIGRCLESLLSLQLNRESFEVILVDNGSTDRTLEIARAYGSRVPIRILEKPKVYISAVRNAGAAVARGRYLSFLDSDCEVLPDWLTQASQAISSGTKGVLGAFYSIPEKSSWIARYWYEERDQKRRGEVSFLPAGNLFVSSEVFRQVHGFDETIQTNEDYEFCQRVRAAGFPITCLPELSVIHWGTPQSLGEFFGKHRWHGTHVMRVFFRSLPSLYNLKAVVLALYTLPCLLGLAAGIVVAVISGHFQVFGVCLLALVGPAIVLGISGAIASRRLVAAAPLTALYFTYAVARACCLLDFRSWFGASCPGE